MWKRVGRHGPAVEHPSKNPTAQGDARAWNPRSAHGCVTRPRWIWMAVIMSLPLLGVALFFFYAWQLALPVYLILVAVSAFFDVLMMRSIRSPGAHWPRRDGRIDGSCPQLEWRFGASNVERGNLAIAREGVLQGRTDGEDRRLVPSDRSGKICYRSLTAHGRTRESRDDTAHGPPTRLAFGRISAGSGLRNERGSEARQ